MGDLKNPKLLWLKGGLFLFLGLLSAALILVEMPNAKVALLLALTVWAFCRAYYFAFYVIEKYVDAEFRFSGLLAFIGYMLRKKKDSA